MFKMADMEALKIVFVLFLSLGLSHANRKLTTTFHTVGEGNSTVSIGYVEAKGTADSLHYLFSSEGVPVVLVVKTKATATVKIESEKITVDPLTDVLYNYGVAFSRLIQYNDSNDNADMEKYDPNSNTTWNSYPFGDFEWENMAAQSDPKTNTILMNVSHSYLNEMMDTNGSITIRFKAYSDPGREDQLPHMQFNENITQFDLSVDHVMTNLSKGRFAVEMIILGKGTEKFKLDESRSIDDEYTPGVFSINNWLTDPTMPSNTGFFQWKPVCYQSMSRARNVASSMKHYGLKLLKADQEEQLDSSILKWYYGDSILGITRQAMNFSFGMPQDGGYNKSEVISWSASMGVGTPPEDTVSTVVIIIIAAGLGIPVIIIMLGGIYVCVKRRNNKDPKPLQSIQNGYQPIPSDM